MKITKIVVCRLYRVSVSVQTVARARKKAGRPDVAGRESVASGAAVHAPRSSDVPATEQRTPATDDDQAAYVGAWRLDKTLQLAADISNLCVWA